LFASEQHRATDKIFGQLGINLSTFQSIEYQQKTEIK